MVGIIDGYGEGGNYPSFWIERERYTYAGIHWETRWPNPGIGHQIEEEAIEKLRKMSKKKEIDLDDII